MIIKNYQEIATTAALIMCIAIIALEIVQAFFEWQQEKNFGYSEESRNILKAQIVLLLFAILTVLSAGGC